MDLSRKVGRILQMVTAAHALTVALFLILPHTAHAGDRARASQGSDFGCHEDDRVAFGKPDEPDDGNSPVRGAHPSMQRDHTTLPTTHTTTSRKLDLYVEIRRILSTSWIARMGR